VQETCTDKFAINKATHLEQEDINMAKRQTWTDLDDGCGFPSRWIFLQPFFVCLHTRSSRDILLCLQARIQQWEQSSDKMEASFVRVWHERSWCQTLPGSDWKPLQKSWTFRKR